MSKRILYVTQEMEPYTTLSNISGIVRQLAPSAKDDGYDVRILMPKYGTINERRHKLHEVVRLSGMNIIVDDEDYPLIIKVATLPSCRLQVYFLDNDEFFKRKFMFQDAEGENYDDNAERMVFFCKGVLETLKKFGWAPDIIHCHGWMTAMIPFYLKNVYKNEPIFADSKLIYSAYDLDVSEKFKKRFIEKANINDLGVEELDNYKDGDDVLLNKGAINYADGVIVGSENVEEYVKSIAGDRPVLSYQAEGMVEASLTFYNEFLPQTEEENE